MSTGAKVKLASGKVGERVIRVVMYVPHLKMWIETQHPNPEPDNFLWVNEGMRNHGKPMSYSSKKAYNHCRSNSIDESN